MSLLFALKNSMLYPFLYTNCAIYTGIAKELRVLGEAIKGQHQRNYRLDGIEFPKTAFKHQIRAPHAPFWFVDLILLIYST